MKPLAMILRVTAPPMVQELWEREELEVRRRGLCLLFVCKVGRIINGVR